VIVDQRSPSGIALQPIDGQAPGAKGQTAIINCPSRKKVRGYSSTP
jgi:hypothetical protein